LTFLLINCHELKSQNEIFYTTLFDLIQSRALPSIAPLIRHKALEIMKIMSTNTESIARIEYMGNTIPLIRMIESSESPHALGCVIEILRNICVVRKPMIEALVVKEKIVSRIFTVINVSVETKKASVGYFTFLMNEYPQYCVLLSEALSWFIDYLNYEDDLELAIKTQRLLTCICRETYICREVS